MFLEKQTAAKSMLHVPICTAHVTQSLSSETQARSHCNIFNFASGMYEVCPWIHFVPINKTVDVVNLAPLDAVVDLSL